MNQINCKDERYYQAYLNHNHISRRGLLRSMFRSVEATQSEQRSQARPPFATKESLFLAICNGCAACATACPYGLIQLQHGKPTLQIDFSACDFCEKCAEVCPTHALHPAFCADTELRPQFSAACLNKQGQHCTECQQKCPQNAIIFEQHTPKISKNCNGCGECQLACFLHAITLSLK